MKKFLTSAFVLATLAGCNVSTPVNMPVGPVVLTQNNPKGAPARSPQGLKKVIAKLATEAFAQQYDKNKDGHLTEQEAPEIFFLVDMAQFDLNHDGKLNKAEFLRYAQDEESLYYMALKLAVELPMTIGDADENGKLTRGEWDAFVEYAAQKPFWGDKLPQKADFNKIDRNRDGAITESELVDSIAL